MAQLILLPLTVSCFSKIQIGFTSSFRLYLELRDIWRPGAGLAGTRESMGQIRDIPGNPGRVATLLRKWSGWGKTQSYI